MIKSQNYPGEQSSKNNITNTIEYIRAKSPTLKEMADKGKIKIVGAYYNIRTGEVNFL